MVITKRGKPVARLVPVEPPASLLRSLTYLVSDAELLAPTGGTWDAAEQRL